jgi:hypothetical protein
METISDEERERLIEALGHQMVMSADLAERARLWRQLKDEIAHRSPAQVNRMESERGLR